MKSTPRNLRAMMKLDSVSEDRVARTLLSALSRYNSWTVLDISFVGQECPTHTYILDGNV
ncbi:MAG: hypothetical protein DMG94_13725, partial [Acidobacteria bacterium]